MTVTLLLPDPSPVILLLTDVLGRTVREVPSIPAVAGVHTVSLKSDGLATGIYFLQLRLGDQRLDSMRLVHLK